MNKELEQDQFAKIAANELSERFTLPISKQSFKLFGGNYQGKSAGSSIDFREHREFQYGDDPRHINWQAYARTGDYILKLYEEEVRPTVDILLDCSNSMIMTSNKELLTKVLLHFCIEACEKLGASYQIWGLESSNTVRLSKYDCVGPTLQFTGTQGGMIDALHQTELRAGALQIIISDLLFPQDPLLLATTLKRNRGRSIFMVCQDPEEVNPGWDGDLDLLNAGRGSNNVVWYENRLK